jgi:inosine-uridine nucleoside N-ribohydrolase
MTSARRPVIIDTDLSFDDYVALLFLFQRPDIDVRAITVVNGTAHVKRGVENARRLLSFTGRAEIPVAGGPERPLEGEHAFPSLWRLSIDFGIRLLLPGVPPAPSLLSAPDLICRQIAASDSPITFIALGPLTNLALALRADPTLTARLEIVYISGGAIDVAGTVQEEVPSNPNHVAEWNFYADPVAADEVFNSGVRLALVPLDVTHVHGPRPLLFDRDLVRRMAACAHGRTPKLMIRLIHLWQLLRPQSRAIPVWDGVVAAIAAEPAIGSDWRDLALRVVTQPESLAGQTVVELNKPANARVCMAGDPQAFEVAYLAAMQD